MDLYSFGVLCLWVLFWEKLAEMNEHLPEGERTALAKNILAKVQANLEAQAQRNPKDQDSVDIVVLQTVNTMEAESNKTLEFALDLASSVGDLKPMLEELFQTVLSLKPRERSNIKEIRGILARGLYVKTCIVIFLMLTKQAVLKRSWNLIPPKTLTRGFYQKLAAPRLTMLLERSTNRLQLQSQLTFT